MMTKKMYLLLLAMALWSSPAVSAPDGLIRQSDAICDPWNPRNCLQPDASGVIATASAPSTSTAVGIVPVVTSVAAATLVVKTSAGNLYSISATNLTATTGYLQVFNATSAPADGAVAPIFCAPLPSSGVVSLSFSTPAVFATGVSAAVSSATTCFTKTTGVITAFISGSVK